MFAVVKFSHNIQLLCNFETQWAHKCLSHKCSPAPFGSLLPHLGVSYPFDKLLLKTMCHIILIKGVTPLCTGSTHESDVFSKAHPAKEVFPCGWEKHSANSKGLLQYLD